MLNFCANNYLGLADHPAVVAAAHDALDRWGYGLASVRFICGTQELHKRARARARASSSAPRTRSSTRSCFDANGGLFETLLGERGRGHLRRAQPRLDHRRHPALQGRAPPLRATATWTSSRRGCARPQDARLRLIATDGVFSMDGYLAPLDAICDLADRYGALVMVDDSPRRRLHRRRPAAARPSTAASSTASTSSPARSARRSAARAAATPRGRARDRRAAAAALAAVPVLELARAADRRRVARGARPARLRRRAARAAARQHRAVPRRDDRRRLRDPARRAPDRPGDVRRREGRRHRRAADARARRLRVPFSYPVVPHGQARIRTQLSAAHTPDDVDRAVAAFIATR